jgi:hypothetical protein
LPRYEYIHMLLSRFPEEIITKYNLRALDVDGWTYQANYINALAVSISPFFEPARPTLGELSPPVGDLFHDIG